MNQHNLLKQTPEAHLPNRGRSRVSITEKRKLRGWKIRNGGSFSEEVEVVAKKTTSLRETLKRREKKW